MRWTQGRLANAAPARQESQWSRPVLLVVLVMAAIALASWKLALFLGGLLLVGWCALWVMIHVGFDLVIGAIRVLTDVMDRVLTSSMAGEQAVLSGTYADIARHSRLLEARYPDEMAEAERERYEKRSALMDRKEPFDLVGQRARNRVLRDRLLKSAAPFVAELREGNRRHGWFGDEELAVEEAKIHRMRKELLAERRSQLQRRRRRRASCN